MYSYNISKDEKNYLVKDVVNNLDKISPFSKIIRAINLENINDMVFKAKFNNKNELVSNNIYYFEEQDLYMENHETIFTDYIEYSDNNEKIDRLNISFDNNVTLIFEPNNITEELEIADEVFENNFVVIVRVFYNGDVRTIANYDVYVEENTIYFKVSSLVPPLANSLGMLNYNVYILDNKYFNYQFIYEDFEGGYLTSDNFVNILQF